MSESETEFELEAYAEALRGIARRAHAPEPDFADVAERARAAGHDIEVPELGAGEGPSGSDTVAPFVAAAQERAALVRAPAEYPSAAGRRISRGVVALGAIAACAAAIAVWVGTATNDSSVVGERSLARHDAAARTHDVGIGCAAEFGTRSGRELAKSVAPPTASVLRWSSGHQAARVAAYASVDPLVSEEDHFKRVPVDEEIARLDAEARERWRAGDLVGAEKLFRQAIRIGGRRPAVDVIYGDVLLLARQLRGPAGQAEAWRKYLRRFPKGRFSDDAQAGLCRRAGAARDCWLEYLRRHPRGAHRDEAMRATKG